MARSFPSPVTVAPAVFAGCEVVEMRSNRNSFALLRVDRLEDRSTPAQFGTPWSDPTHLTLSFAPDGTPAVGGATSELFTALDAQMPRAVWQGAILRAVQTWSEQAGVNVGVTADGGQTFGATGPSQGDPRFGDIRIGGLPMAFELAQATPPDPTLAGTLAGDITLNTRAAFTPESLFRVALHEVGHALGLPPSADPSSVMFNTFNATTTLSASDVADLRGLYGSRAADANEGATGNGSVKDASRIKFSSSFDGATPLVVYGDVTTPTDVDVFYLPVLDTYSGPVTVRVQTDGVSQLSPRVTVTERNGSVLAAASGTGARGEVVTLTLPGVKAGGKYYLRVEAAAGATVKVGRYGLAVTFDSLNRVAPATTAGVLRGPYNAVTTEDLITLFRNPTAVTFNDDAGTNDTAPFATTLPTALGFPANTRYRTTAGISPAADADFYRVRSPRAPSGSLVVLTATVRAVAPNGAVQRIEVYDARQVRVPATLLSNGNGTFTVQATGLAANTDYYVRVGGGLTGNYQLDVGFGSKATTLTTFSTGTVPAGGTVAAPLYLGQTQVFAFNLAVTGGTGTPVTLTIADSLGRVVFSLDGTAGDTVSGVTPLLAPGEYRLTVSAVGSTSPVGFTLRGGVITDPIGPQLADSATAPQYQTPGGGYTYPPGTSTPTSYLFWLWMLI